MERLLNPVYEAYLAGFFDGEGCVLIHKEKLGSNTKYTLRVTISQANEIPLLEFQRRFGGSIQPLPRRKETHRPCMEWVILENGALLFLQKMCPYLIVKTDQVELAIEFGENVQQVGHPYLDQEVNEYREYVYLKLQELKRVSHITEYSNNQEGYNGSPLAKRTGPLLHTTS